MGNSIHPGAEVMAHAVYRARQQANQRRLGLHRDEPISWGRGFDAGVIEGMRQAALLIIGIDSATKQAADNEIEFLTYRYGRAA